jgi:hypothetical protein
VAVVDLDGFKTINDTHGHHAGDVCIRYVADVIGRSVREGDWLARWGEDEFVLALWDDSVFASPEAVLGRTNADLRRSPVRLPGGEELVLSISVGRTGTRVRTTFGSCWRRQTRRCSRQRGNRGHGFWPTRQRSGGLIYRRYLLEARRHGGEGPPDRGRLASRAFTFAQIYPAPQHLVLTRMPWVGGRVGSSA